MAGIKTFTTRAVKEKSITRSCPLCKQSRTNKSWPTQGIIFYRCASCGLWRQDPQPLPEAIHKRYGDDYLEYEIEMQLAYREIALMSLAEAGLFPENGKGRSILEVGCATGALLSVFKSGGWKAQGVELGGSMAAYGRERWSLDIKTGVLEDQGFTASSRDVFLATHLIEHLNEPMKFLEEAARILKPEGKIYLVTPNVSSFQAWLTGPKWRSAIRDHLYLFSKSSIDAMLKKNGFRTEFIGSWGGWPAGMKPLWLKKPVDRLAKLTGLGDVMVIRAGKEE